MDVTAGFCRRLQRATPAWNKPTTQVMVNGLPRVKPSRAQSHDLRKPTHKLVVPVAMQTRQGRQQAALLAMKAFFTNDDLLSLVINDALPAAGAPPCCLCACDMRSCARADLLPPLPCRSAACGVQAVARAG